MSLFASPRFLRNVLLIDATTGLGCGALQLCATAWLTSLTGLPSLLLQESGMFLLLLGVFLLWLSLRNPIPVAGVWCLVVGNLAWVAACVVLMVGPWIESTTWGLAYLGLQAVTVLLLAELQWMGLRQSRPSRLATA